MEHTIKFYPVNNADCTLIKLSNGMTIIVDCQFYADLTNDDGEQILYDVKKDLLKELKTDEKGRPFVDLFVNTHPHSDHCLGFGDHFYCGDISTYDCERDAGKIIIGELWVTPIIMGNSECEDAKDIRREAKRRRTLYNADSSFNGSDGNYLRIIGYDKDKEFDARYSYVPGVTVSQINGQMTEWLNIFVHAPFKEDIATSKEKNDKNAASIVMQYSFFVEGYDEPKCRLLMGGDAEHDAWQHILDNNTDDKNLSWNIFLAPHHCSWTFFNDTRNEDDVCQSAEDILNLKTGSKPYIISSAQPIKDDGINPPSYKAKKEYLAHLCNPDHFRNTSEDYSVNGIPQPIVFKINAYGKRITEHNVDIAGSRSYTRPAPRAGEHE